MISLSLKPTRSHARTIIALDFADAGTALALAQRLSPQDCKLKVGLELFSAAGPDVVRRLVDLGFDVFLDLKFHDIPNTVAQACTQAAKLGVWMLNVHALGGGDMMRAAAAAVHDAPTRPLLIAVTVLTSHSPNAFRALGNDADLTSMANNLAATAQTAGLDGVVCSGHEAAALRARFGAGFTLVTPGIRFADGGHDDQSRVVSPAQAIQAGADYIVVGRPITRASDPIAALAAVNAQLTVARNAG